MAPFLARVDRGYRLNGAVCQALNAYEAWPWRLMVSSSGVEISQARGIVPAYCVDVSKDAKSE